jgi:hypothetical protein
MYHTGRIGLLLLGLSLPRVAVAAPWSLPTPPTETIVVPGGIADPTGHTGFFANATGGIDAVDLARGRLLWQTHEAQVPLLVVGHHLYAQAGLKRNRMRILRFDLTREGECDLESDPIVFPNWVVTGEAPAHSFHTKCRVDKEHLVLDWEARAWYSGTTRPTPAQDAAARKRAAGIILVELDSGRVEVQPRPTTESPPPALPAFLEKKAVRWHGVVGSHYKALALEEVEDDEEEELERLVLYSWDNRTNMPEFPKLLFMGKQLLVRPTLDERFLCIREKAARPDDHGFAGQSKPSHWALFSLETGALMGRFPDESGMHSLFVHGTRLYYLVGSMAHGSFDRPRSQPRTLKVLDLSTGKKVWEHAVMGKLVIPPP